MTFNKCAIAGRSYGDILDEKTGEPIDVDEVRRSGDLKPLPVYHERNLLMGRYHKL
jgi:hypothetical protein